MVTIITVPGEDFSLKGWTPISLNDEAGFGISMMSRLSAAEDAVGEGSFKVITTVLLEVARAIHFERERERTGVRSQLVKNT